MIRFLLLMTKVSILYISVNLLRPLARVTFDNSVAARDKGYYLRGSKNTGEIRAQVNGPQRPRGL